VASKVGGNVKRGNGRKFPASKTPVRERPKGPVILSIPEEPIPDDDVRAALKLRPEDDISAEMRQRTRRILDRHELESRGIIPSPAGADYLRHVAEGKAALWKAALAVDRAARCAPDKGTRNDLASVATVLRAVLLVGFGFRPAPAKLRKKLTGASVQSWAERCLDDGRTNWRPFDLDALADELLRTAKAYKTGGMGPQRIFLAQAFAMFVRARAPWLAPDHALRPDPSNDLAERIYAAMPCGGMRRDRTGAHKMDDFVDDPRATVRAALRARGVDRTTINNTIRPPLRPRRRRP
jgi:hypothetical protein